jgi:diadenosine tetraphosphate (Ap4A) HIT family hydrolase
LPGWPGHVKLEKVKLSSMTTLIHRRVEEAQQGTNPYVICRMPSGWAVLGDTQILPGYSILLSDPVVLDLNALSLRDRLSFLRDMSIVGDALLEVTGAALINYEILGNADRALHAHIMPRYSDEPDETRRRPIWFSDWANAPKFDSAREKNLMQKLADSIQKRLNEHLDS